MGPTLLACESEWLFCWLHFCFVLALLSSEFENKFASISRFFFIYVLFQMKRFWDLQFSFSHTFRIRCDSYAIYPMPPFEFYQDSVISTGKHQLRR